MTPQVRQKPAPPQTAKPDQVSAYAWYVVIALTAIYTLSFIDRQIMGLVVAPIKKELAISDTRVALLQGLAFALFYTILGLPMGRIADKHSRRNLVSAGVGFWSFFTAACAVARSFWSLFFARMGVGVGEAALAPAAYSMVADYFPKERLGLAMSIYYCGNILGSSLAMIVGGSVVQAVSQNPETTLPLLGTIASWRVTFLVIGVPGILFALLALTVREPVRRGVLQTASGSTSYSWGEAFTEIMRRGQTMAGVSLAFVFQAASNYGFMAWVNPYFQRVHGWNIARSGVNVGLVVLIFGCAGLYFGGWLCDRWQRRGITDAPLRVAIPCAAGMLVLFPIAMQMPSPLLSLAFIGPGLFFMAMPMGTAAAALQLIFPNQLRGVVTALYLFILNLGALTIGPLLPALFNDYLFRDEKMVGSSIGLTIGLASVVMLGIILLTLRPFRRDYEAMHGSQAS
jgi:MFS family permease